MKNVILSGLVIAIIVAIVLFSGFGVSAATVGKVILYGLVIALMIKALPPMLEKKNEQ